MQERKMITDKERAKSAESALFEALDLIDAAKLLINDTAEELSILQSASVKELPSISNPDHLKKTQSMPR